jgi:signal transduction histidine kinase
LTDQQSTNVKFRAKEVIAPFVLEAKAQGIDLILALDDPSLDPVPNVMTDPFRLGQVLVNLVSNAMRYSGDGPVQRVLINFAMRSEPPMWVHAHIHLTICID